MSKNPNYAMRVFWTMLIPVAILLFFGAYEQSRANHLKATCPASVSK